MSVSIGSTDRLHLAAATPDGATGCKQRIMPMITSIVRSVPDPTAPRAAAQDD
jgi:hypothetical protein